MLIRMVESNTPSVNKSPSPELFSLIKAAATNLLGFGELWGSIRKKGHDEGFSDKELQDMLRPYLKEKLDSKKVWYLFHQDEQKKRSHEQYQSRTNISTNDVKKELEQSYNPDEEIKKIGEIRRDLAKKEAEEPITPDDEDPQALEIQFLKEKVAELEDALKKTEQFKPATQLQQQQEPATDEHYFKWLTDKADGIHSFYYDTYGIDLFKNRELSQLKNSGVKVFKRLYFEV